MGERPAALDVQDGIHNGQSEQLGPGIERTLLKSNGGDLGPLPITISWSLDIPFQGAPQILAGPTKCSVEGVLDFGVGGTSHSCRFDWGRGGAITATATSFHLKARGDSTNTITPTARATVAYYQRVGNDAGRVCLSNSFDIDSTREAIIWAPTFGHLVTVYASDFSVLVNGELIIEALRINGTKVFEFVPRNCTIKDAVELVNEVRFLKIKKTTPGGVTGAVLHHLAL